MTYQELVDVLRDRQAAYGNMQPTSIKAPTLDQIISGIQSQYQQNAMQQMLPQLQTDQSFGAARFTNGPQTFIQQEFTPVVSSVPQFVPGAFDINKYTTKTQANDIINMIQSFDGGDYGSGDRSSLQGNVENWGDGFSLGTLGKGAMALLSGSPLSMINAFLSGKQDLANATYGTTTTNPDGSKTISGYIQGQPFSYTESSGSVSIDPMGYGVPSTSIGAPSAEQAAAQAQAFADALSGYSSYASDSSQSYGGGDTTSASNADSTASDNSGVGGW